MDAKKAGAWCLWLCGMSVLSQTVDKGLVAVNAEQSRIVVYSLAESHLSGVTSVFVNGAYHASLLKGAWTDLCYSPGRAELGARQTVFGQRARDRLDTVTPLQLQGGQVHYLRVNEQNGSPLLESVPQATAVRELPGKRLQALTLSRAAQDCIEAPQTPVVPVQSALSTESNS